MDSFNRSSERDPRFEPRWGLILASVFGSYLPLDRRDRGRPRLEGSFRIPARVGPRGSAMGRIAR